MAEWRLRSQFDGTLRVLACLGGSALAALMAVCLARLLPVEQALRFALGFGLAIPFWVAAMCAAWLARSGARACLWCAGSSLGLLVLALGRVG